MHYFKRNIGDYHKKAGRLSMLEHGAYTLLLDACYDRERFPTKDEAIDWTWARSPEEVAAVEFVLSKFFTLDDGRYVQTRIAEEVEAYHQIAQKNKAIAEKREADKRTKRAQQGTTGEQGVNDSPPNQEPLTTNHKPVDQKPLSPAAPATTPEKPARKKSDKFDPLTARPVSVSQEAWADFCAHRHRKSALSAKACELIANKLATHHDPDAVLYRSIENGWTGIFPEQVPHEASPNIRATGRLSAVDAVKHAIATRETAEARPGLAGQAMAEDGGAVRAALDGEFRRVG